MTMPQVHASLSRPNEVLPYNDYYNYHVINTGHLLRFALVGQHGLGASHSGTCIQLFDKLSDPIIFSACVELNGALQVLPFEICKSAFNSSPGML